MPLVMQRLPTRAELGPDYFRVFINLCMFYLVTTSILGDQPWLVMLERECRLAATGADLVVDMRIFIESFYVSVQEFDFELSRILRQLAAILNYNN